MIRLFRNSRFRFYLLVTLCAAFFSIKIYRNTNPPLTGWDVFGYYVYLPQTFIYKDFQMKEIYHLENIFKKYNLPGTLYQVNANKNGTHTFKYTSGWAILNSPFFIGAHIYAKINDYETDGFSSPYQWSIMIASIFYCVLGMFLVGILLLRFFDVTVSSLAFLFLVFGTNYYFINTDAFTMPHVHLFTLYAALILLSDNWHKRPSVLNSISLGVTLALMILIRPTELIAGLIPLLWGVFSFADFKDRLNDLKYKFLKPLIIVFVSLVSVGMLQIIYWKLSSGQFLYYGYNNAGEGFEFFHPNLINVLFGFRKGWFIYTPIALFFIGGLFYTRKENFHWGVLLFTIINIYIISCWTNWWYAESFSQRPLMHSLPVLIIPFGFLIQRIVEKRNYILFSLFILFTALNIFQTWQTNVGIIHGSRMTFSYYKAVFLKTYIPEGAEKLLLVDRSEFGENNFVNSDNYNLTKSFTQDFEYILSKNLSTVKKHSGNYSIIVNNESPYSIGIDASFSDLTSLDHAWLKIGVWINLSDSVKKVKPTLVTTFEHDGEPYTYRGKNLDEDTTTIYLPNQWYYLETFYLTPEIRLKSDKFKAYIWMRGEGKIFVDDLKVEVFEPKY